METALFITVGGSPQPVIRAIKSLKPVRVVFICSGGKNSSVVQVTGGNLPCIITKNGTIVEKLPNIPEYCNLGDAFDAQKDILILEDMDDLDSCYGSILKKIREVKKDQFSILGDYTGGTKTMSVALGLAAVDENCQLYLTTGQRKNLIKVSSGEYTEDVNLSGIYVEKTIQQIRNLHLEKFDYSGAVLQLSQLLRTRSLNNTLKKRVRTLLKYCQAFDAWDRFNHQRAWEFMEDSMDDPFINPYGIQLKRVIQSRKAIDSDCAHLTGIKGHGYELIEDLIFNAQRRAEQSRYDDAVGRIYRALELMIQLYLKNRYDISTSDLDTSRLPEEIRNRYEILRSDRNKQIQIGLKLSYALLAGLADEQLQPLYELHENKIEGVLNIRNHSLYAHGFKSVSKGDFEKFYTTGITFLYDAIQIVTPQVSRMRFYQFPQDFA